MSLPPNAELEDQWAKWTINHNGHPPRFAYCSPGTLARLQDQSITTASNIYGGATRVVAVNPNDMGPIFGPFLERGGIYLSDKDKDEKVIPKKQVKRYGFWRR